MIHSLSAAPRPSQGSHHPEKLKELSAALANDVFTVAPVPGNTPPASAPEPPAAGAVFHPIEVSFTKACFQVSFGAAARASSIAWTVGMGSGACFVAPRKFLGFLNTGQLPHAQTSYATFGAMQALHGISPLTEALGGYNVFTAHGSVLLRDFHAAAGHVSSLSNPHVRHALGMGDRGRGSMGVHSRNPNARYNVLRREEVAAYPATSRIANQDVLRARVAPQEALLRASARGADAVLGGAAVPYPPGCTPLLPLLVSGAFDAHWRLVSLTTRQRTINELRHRTQPAMMGGPAWMLNRFQMEKVEAAGKGIIEDGDAVWCADPDGAAAAFAEEVAEAGGGEDAKLPEIFSERVRSP